MRMGIRRFTRLTNAFSKKIENHFYALAIYFMHYNYVRIHTSLRVTPAMAAGVAHKLWSMGDVVRIVDEADLKGYQIRATRLAMRAHPAGISLAALCAEMDQSESLIYATLRYLEDDREVALDGSLW